MYAERKMGGMHLCMFLFATVIALAAANKYDVDEVLKKIPDSEKTIFLRHHVTLGYELLNVDIKRNNKIPQELKELPAEFSKAVYEKYRKNHVVPSNAVLNSRENIICFPNGECIDIGDPGVHPII